MAVVEHALVERNGGTTELTTASSAADMRRRLQEMREKVSVVQAFFRDVMVKDEDYGVIPGTQKPTLLKPGAEKLCEFYGYAITIKEERKTQNIETGYCEYEVVVALTSRRTGEIVAEGVGSANTMESRYRWRWVWPSDVPADVDKSNLKTRRINTRNGKATQYRLENDDPWSLWNTVKKMAKKRALIDAALSATRSSGIFTQDMDELREWAANGEVIDAEFTTSDERQEPKQSASGSTRNGNSAPKADETKRDDYHAAIRSYLSQAHKVESVEYTDFINFAIGGDPNTCDIERLAELARYAYGAEQQGSKTAAAHIAGFVEDWRKAMGIPDDVPTGEENVEQPAFV